MMSLTIRNPQHVPLTLRLQSSLYVFDKTFILTFQNLFLIKPIHVSSVIQDFNEPNLLPNYLNELLNPFAIHSNIEPTNTFQSII